MFFRLKKSGERGYVQIVENKRDERRRPPEGDRQRRPRRRVGAALRRARLSSSEGFFGGQAHRLARCSSTRSTRTPPKARCRLRRSGDRWADAVRPDLERLGVADVLATHLLKERAFEFPVRARPCSSPRCIGYSSSGSDQR